MKRGNSPLCMEYRWKLAGWSQDSVMAMTEIGCLSGFRSTVFRGGEDCEECCECWDGGLIGSFYWALNILVRVFTVIFVVWSIVIVNVDVGICIQQGIGNGFSSIYFCSATKIVSIFLWFSLIMSRKWSCGTEQTPDSQSLLNLSCIKKWTVLNTPWWPI